MAFRAKDFGLISKVTLQASPGQPDTISQGSSVYLTMKTEKDPILVIGAGGAGLIAAWRAAFMGARVVVLERNIKAGIKLLISGGGKCNITHDGPMEDMRRTFRLREARFLRHAFHCFSNDDIRRLLAGKGVATFTRPNGRVFPVSGRASDVVAALMECLRDAGVEIRLRAKVERILAAENAVTGVRVNGLPLRSRHVILATGGGSYRKTGTTGDGFTWAGELGHTIIPVLPALAPISVSPVSRAWRGIALRGGRLDVCAHGKKIDSWQDDVLFTHEGISGPAALEVSRTAGAALGKGEVTLRFDFFPDRDFSTLDEELTSLLLVQHGRHISTILDAWLPNRLVPHLLASIHVAADTRGYRLTRDERRSIVRLMKSWELGRVSAVPIDRGEVTAGGIALDEVDPASMRSRKVKGLFVAGEVLDVAGRVGGYNLQAAYATGYVAGEAAARDWLESIPS